MIVGARDQAPTAHCEGADASRQHYSGDDPELNRELDERQAMVDALNAIPYERKDERRAGFERLLAAIGEGTFIRPPFYCDFGDGISIGARTFINFNCTMLDGAPITIGDECCWRRECS